VQLKQRVDLKLTFQYKAARFAQRRLKRGPQKVVKYCKNKKVSRKKTLKQEKKSDKVAMQLKARGDLLGLGFDWFNVQFHSILVSV